MSKHTCDYDATGHCTTCGDYDAIFDDSQYASDDDWDGVMADAEADRKAREVALTDDDRKRIAEYSASEARHLADVDAQRERDRNAMYAPIPTVDPNSQDCEADHYL